MNNQLSEDVLSFLKYAPLVLMFHAFWIMDNQQMFGNKWTYIDKTFKPMLSKHYFTSLHFNQSTPLAYCIIFITIMILIMKVIPFETLNRYGFGMYKKMIKVHEGLPKFKNAMQRENLNRMQILKNHIHQTYGFEFIEQLFIDIQKGGRLTSRKLQNDPYYNIQFIPSYMRKFAYIGPHVKNLDNLLKDGDDVISNNRFQSDVVSIFLNLSAIPDECISKLRISEDDYDINLKREMDAFLSRLPKKDDGSPAGMHNLYENYKEFISQKDISMGDESIELEKKAIEKKFELEKSLAKKKKGI